MNLLSLLLPILPLLPLTLATPPPHLYDLSAMLRGYVLCTTTAASPRVDPAISAIQSLRARLYRPAVQDKSSDPFCTDLTKSGTAYTAICGPQDTVMRSMDAGKMANQIYRFCRAEVGGVWRVGGVYVFDGETVPVGRMVLYAVGEEGVDGGEGEGETEEKREVIGGNGEY
ncbi:uncharacterized protein H6S33_010057 [Morchella sextelata]|uniref:uncharacterized protein n=1 Tax=Morchella sextelata TaxID=1174677 RepID=UPI001D050CD3|nr:uncharacterized protein H6S33_010057 [Morchella sextelata]KAH0612005.1 hypothetical protein H6S33_010057 [Morchella sextelata]